MRAIGGLHGGWAGVGDFGDGLPKLRAADVQVAAVSFGKRGSRDVERGEGSIAKVKGTKESGYEGSFFEFFCSGCKSFAEFGELEEAGRHGQIEQ